MPIMRRKKGERAPGVSGNRQLAAVWNMSGTCLTLTIAAGFSRLIRPVLVYAENKDKPRPRAERGLCNSSIKRTKKKQRGCGGRRPDEKGLLGGIDVYAQHARRPQEGMTLGFRSIICYLPWAK